MSSPEATLLITNPGSRTGELEHAGILSALEEICPLYHYVIDDNFSIDKILSKHKGQLARIVVGGGDGTLNWLLDAVRHSNLPMGVLPLGTANDFARSLNIPLDPVQAVDTIQAGHMRKIDIGMVNDVSFLNALGIGLGPALTKELSAEKKARWGIVSYLTSLLLAYKQNKSFKAQVIHDGAKLNLRCIQITVANGIHYGGGMTISQDAKFDDALLDVICILKHSLPQLVFRALNFRVGDFEKVEGVRNFSTQEISIITKRKMDVSADGELLTHTPIICTVVPQAITVYAPPKVEGS